MARIEANGISFETRVEGREGAPWLTFSNSLACNFSLWDEQVAPLAADFRILRYDTRGHGGSDATAGDYDFDLLTGDVVGLWDALEIEASHFVGLSLGGMTGLGLALGHPDRMISLAACDCRADAPQMYLDNLAARCTILDEDGIEPLAEANLATWFTASYVASGKPLLDRARAMVRTTSRDGFVGCVGALKGLDYIGRLGEIAVPTLYAVGGEDGGFPAAMKDMHEATPGSRYEIIPRAAHLSNLENPADFNRIVGGFLRGLAPGVSTSAA